MAANGLTRWDLLRALREDGCPVGPELAAAGPDASETGALTPDLGPGDVVLFENRTYHAGGVNRTARARLAVFLQYGFRWLNPVDTSPGC